MSKKIKITRVKSSIKERKNHKKTLKALGLNKNYKSVVKPDNDSIRGMAKSVNHLVKIEKVEE